MTVATMEAVTKCLGDAGTTRDEGPGHSPNEVRDDEGPQQAPGQTTVFDFLSEEG